ncbi:MAG: hypothetical protein QW291_01330 [Thermofilaceae archaeon]
MGEGLGIGKTEGKQGYTASAFMLANSCPAAALLFLLIGVSEDFRRCKTNYLSRSSL